MLDAQPGNTRISVPHSQIRSFPRPAVRKPNGRSMRTVRFRSRSQPDASESGDDIPIFTV
ncbi:MAG: hypothetical protein SWY16_01220 [Cyanobacteriota bacterium]|nr:hypothetical protein [Cyanobacteriota bacterium]